MRPNRVMASSLDDLFVKHGTDKSSQWHNYSRQYGPLLERFRSRGDPVRYLEIGVYNGASVRAFAEFLPPGSLVVGMDIDPATAKHAAPDRGIFVHIADATDPGEVARVMAAYGPFDIVVDDGSHLCSHVVATFEALFPYVVDGGLYIVEDTNVAYVAPYADLAPAVTHLSYFAQLINMLNMNTSQFSLVADPFKVPHSEPDPVRRAVDKIEFGCGYIAVTKLERKHWAALAALSAPM